MYSVHAQTYTHIHTHNHTHTIIHIYIYILTHILIHMPIHMPTHMPTQKRMSNRVRSNDRNWERSGRYVIHVYHRGQTIQGHAAWCRGQWRSRVRLYNIQVSSRTINIRIFRICIILLICCAFIIKSKLYTV